MVRKESLLLEEEVIHYPNLKTVLMIEDVLKNANTLLTREQLKKTRIYSPIVGFVVYRTMEIAGEKKKVQIGFL